MKAIIAAIISASIIVAPIGSAFAKEKSLSQPVVEDVKSAVLIEKSTGKALYQLNSNKKLPPASMTKIMTMLLIFKALDNGKISLKDKVKVSENAASMGGSQVYLETGEVMSVKNLIKAIAIGSANDASVAMAEYIAGSKDAFVQKMNKTAKQLDLDNTHFVNPTGLPAENHYSTAHDMAVMARALLHYENVLKYTSKYEDYLRKNTDNEFWLVNTNKLVKTHPFVDGLKTGYTHQAKYCLTATGKKNGMRVIAVVMGAPSTKERNKQVVNLLNYAFANYKTKQLVEAGKHIREVPVNKSAEGDVSVVTKNEVVLLTRKGDRNVTYDTAVKIREELHAPMPKGKVVGHYIVKKDGKTVSRTPLVLKNKVEEASWWQLFKRYVGKATTWSW